MEISNWEQLTHVQKTHGIMDGLINGNNRVLFYSDRNLFVEENVWFQPPKSLLNYFRGLNGFQVFSWIGWCLLFGLLNIKWNMVWFMRWIPILTGIAILIQGRVLLSKSVGVIQYNDILFEYGNLFTLHGLGLMGSGIMFYLILKRFSRLFR
jgi:hypothetical protein